MLAIAAVLLSIRYEYRFPTRSADRAGASLIVNLESIISAPAVVYMERWSAPAHAGEPSGEVANLVIEGNVFKPAVQVVHPGSLIEIENRDSYLHNAHVTSRGDTVFNVATPLRSVSVRKPLAASGMLNVRCDLHPGMQAWILVPANDYYRVFSMPGSVKWTHIAPGKYRLLVWEAGIITNEAVVELDPRESETVRLP